MLDKKVADILSFYHKKYNQITFIDTDPISIPHRFCEKQDIEISAFFSAIIAWGNRKTILKNAQSLIQRMDNAPYDFVLNHSENELRKLDGFVHRTFNDSDLLFFISFFKQHYEQYDSLETAFSKGLQQNDENIEKALVFFYEYVCAQPTMLPRTRKHIASPLKNSACKRLCMFLRWMVRNDKQGVDFGIWEVIQPSQLVVPLDVHVLRNAIKLGLLCEKDRGWNAALKLTKALKKYCKTDPAKYDFALFGMGLEK